MAAATAAGEHEGALAMWRGVLLAIAVAACGRIGFDPAASGDGGGGGGGGGGEGGGGGGIDAAPGGSGALALGHAPTCADHSGTTITLAVNVTATDHVGILAFADASSTALSSVSDDGGSTWTVFFPSKGPAGVVYYAAPMVPATTVTVALGSAAGAACFYEVAGLDPANFNASSSGGGGSIASGVLTGATAHTVGPAFIVATATVSSGVTSIAAGNPFTNDSLLHNDGHAHLIVDAAGMYQPAWDVGGGTYSDYVAAFSSP
jgi:hypothetical protein